MYPQGGSPYMNNNGYGGYQGNASQGGKQPQQPYQPGSPMGQMGQQPAFAQQQPQQPQQPGQDMPGMLPVEQSYIENILRLNRGKVGTFYMTFENNDRWNAKIFKGVVEAAGRDHIILSDPESGRRYLLLMVNLDYVTFEEELEYDYPFNMQQAMAQYPPR